ncbi:MAG: CHASE domain-containing protein [Gemmatimonadetes bacterium]|nr:CHASE domain-containing protein [Gemmatimonadota bacterium]
MRKIPGGEPLLSRKPRFGLTPFVVLASSLWLTGALTFSTYQYSEQSAQRRFENAVEGTSDRIRSRLEVYRVALTGGTAAFALTDSLSEEDFRRFADLLDLQEQFPGIQGVGWSERIAYTPHEERTAIRYLEPQDARNRAALGFDMYSEPVRRAAMERARDTGQSALSAPVVLMQEIETQKQLGFLLYVPFYGRGPIPGTVEERRVALRGYVYAPFRAADLFNGIFGSEENPRVRFAIYDGAVTDSTALLYASQDYSSGTARLSSVQRIEQYGQPWTITYESSPYFESVSYFHFAPGSLIAGVGVSLLLFVLTLKQARLRVEAQVANEAKIGFLATMSHELRTPLNAVRGYLDLMEMGLYGSVTDEQKTAILRIRRASTHLLHLIEEVLCFARLDAGKAEFSLNAVDILDVLEHVEAVALPLFEKKDLHYERPPVPPMAVYADRDKVAQVLLNLLSNAVKFTPEMGSVTLAVEAGEEFVRVTVTDSGIGIAPERQTLVFEPFVQVHEGLTRAYHGTGLGLAISRELARGMGGDVTVSSVPQQGSTFTLTLPSARSEDTRPAALV